MKHSRTCFQTLIVSAFFFLTGSMASAITPDEAFNKLETHKFGQNYQVLEYLREAVVTSHSDPTTRKKLNDGFTHILDSDASYDAKQFASRQLALTATEEHIPVLARHLGDEKMTHMALYVLTHIYSPEVDEALLSALETTTGNARLGIINMLGNRRCADAVEPLGRFAISGEEDTSIAAITALGRIGTIAARRQLFFHDIIYDPPKKHSHAKEMAFAHAELDFGDRLAADGKVRQAIDRYRSAFSEDNPAHIRAAGLKGLVTSLGEHARRYGFTAEAWGSDSRELYGMAAALVRTVPDKKTAEAMVAGLPELGPSVQVLLISALAARDDGAGAAFVRAACESHDVHVKQAAIRALGKIGVISSVPLLIAQAAHGAHQDAALESLTDIVGDNVNGVLIGLLHDSDGTEKAVICRVLLGRNATEAASALIDVARTGDPATRAEAIKALHSLAGPRQMPALVDLVFTVEPAEADQIGKALVAVARRNSMQRVCTQGILSKYDQDVNADRRVVLLMTLGELGDEQALSVLRDSLKDRTGKKSISPSEIWFKTP